MTLFYESGAYRGIMTARKDEAGEPAQLPRPTDIIDVDWEEASPKPEEKKENAQ
jgi:hypothetical protein